MTVQRASGTRGFTLIEMVVVVAIVAVLAVLAGSSLSRLKSRATLASTTTELQALIHGARQTAMATGHDVVVMLFHEGPSGGPRALVYEDAAFDFLTTGAVNFDAYDPAKLTSAGESRVLETMDLPAEIVVGPADGLGGSATLAPPLDLIDVRKACSFCSETRGAIRFDPRGSATFYDKNTPAKRPDGRGGSFTLTHTTLGGRSTFVILSSTGAVQIRQVR